MPEKATVPASEAEMDINPDFKTRMGNDVQALKTRVSVLEVNSNPNLKERVAVLENTSSSHGTIIDELRRMFAVSDATMTHHAELAKEQQQNLVRHFETRLDALRVDMKAIFDVAMTKHEKREVENLSKIISGTDKIQKGILVSIVMLLLSVLGTLAYFILEHVPMTS